ncbi:sterile alpha motif domain-containing protein 1-like [Haliaeetus albicilla]|uniref:sterile alpha motif domain-containing protein 1-like n=1 Tax=Haliaeetus albicilla TaxID=8969 RepID=UPI0037E72CE2
MMHSCGDAAQPDRPTDPPTPPGHVNRSQPSGTPTPSATGTNGAPGECGGGGSLCPVPPAPGADRNPAPGGGRGEASGGEAQAATRRRYRPDPERRAGYHRGALTFAGSPASSAGVPPLIPAAAQVPSQAPLAAAAAVPQRSMAPPLFPSRRRQWQRGVSGERRLKAAELSGPPPARAAPGSVPLPLTELPGGSGAFPPAVGAGRTRLSVPLPARAA